MDMEHYCERCDAPNTWDGRSLQNICPDCYASDCDAASDHARDVALWESQEPA